MSDLIDRQNAINAMMALKQEDDERYGCEIPEGFDGKRAVEALEKLPSAEPEIIRCKDCKHWKQQMDYQDTPLSFGFCESEDMWRSLYGETTEVAHIDTDDNHYCGFAERRTDE